MTKLQIMSHALLTYCIHKNHNKNIVTQKQVVQMVVYLKFMRNYGVSASGQINAFVILSRVMFNPYSEKKKL